MIWLMLAAALGFSFYSGYTNCLNVLITLHGAGHEASQFYIFFTPSKFLQFQGLLLAYLIIMSALLFKFEAAFDVTVVYLRHAFVSVTGAVNATFNSEAKYLLLLPLLTSLYFALTMPVNFDEALTYIWFTSKGLFSSLAYYPAPNNHILHSVFTCFTKYIPFIGALLCLRVSSLIATLFNLILLYAMVNRHFKKNTALLVLAISSMMFMSLYYGYMSRGYALAGLFFIVSFYAVLNIINGETNGENFIAFGITSVLGFYTMPSFLYPFIMLNTIMLLSTKGVVLRLIITDAVITAVVLLLYLPVVIVNGIGALINNEYVAPLERSGVLQKLPEFTPGALHEITGIPAIYFIPFLLLAFILLMINRKRKDMVVFLVFLIGPFVLVLAHSVIRYSRTFSYYTFILVFLIVIPWRNQLQKIKTIWLLPLLVIMQFALLNNFSSQIYLYEHYTLTSERVLKTITGSKTYFCDEPMFEIPLQFRLNTGGYTQYKFDRKWNAPLSADTINGYDYVIIRNGLDRTINKTPQIRTEYYNVY